MLKTWVSSITVNIKHYPHMLVSRSYAYIFPVCFVILNKEASFQKQSYQKASTVRKF